MRRRSGRKRALGARAPIAIPQGPNQRWSLDFASDALTDGRRFRILVVVDDFTHERLTLVADTSWGEPRVARELDAIIAVRGQPVACVSDNGTELTSKTIQGWSQDRLTCHGVFPPDGVRVRPEEGRTDEASKVHGRADYRGVEGV